MTETNVRSLNVAANEELRLLNERFIDCVRRGDAIGLNAILSADFQFMMMESGEVWDREKYDAEVAVPGHYETLTIDEVYIQHQGNTAIVGARTHSTRLENGKRLTGHGRYLDAYRREDGKWQCFFACLIRLPN